MTLRRGSVVPDTVTLPVLAASFLRDPTILSVRPVTAVDIQFSFLIEGPLSWIATLF